MEVTKLSEKGQIVIPEPIRRGIKKGTAFVVTKVNKLIILKEVKDFSKEELAEMKELEEIWEDIDAGRGLTMNVDDFKKEMEKWR